MNCEISEQCLTMFRMLGAGLVDSWFSLSKYIHLHFKNTANFTSLAGTTFGLKNHYHLRHQGLKYFHQY
jgi:hypothetical protein